MIPRIFKWFTFLLPALYCTAAINFSDVDNTQLRTNGYKLGIKSGASVTNLAQVGTIDFHLPFMTNNSALLCDGNSLMAGSPKVFYTLTNSFPGWLNFGMISNFAVTGSVMADVNNRWITNIAPAIVAAKAAGLTNIYLMFDIGANEGGTLPSIFTTNWEHYITRAHDSNVMVIAFTIMPQSAAADTSRTNFAIDNLFMRTSLLPDYLIDWARLMPNPWDTAWFVDGTHLTTNGYIRVARAVDTAVRNPKVVPKDATVQLETDGTNMFVYPPGGNFGVLTAAPFWNFSVNGTLGASNTIESTRADNVAFWARNGGVFMAGLVSNYFNGPIGVGTQTPATTLDVVGTIQASSFIKSTRADNLSFYSTAGGFYAGGAAIVSKFLGGVASARGNLAAPTGFTFPNTTVNWTNPLTCNIQVYIDNAGVTGTAIKKNGTTIFTLMTGPATFGLQTNEYFSETYTVGTPVGTYSPF